MQNRQEQDTKCVSGAESRSGTVRCLKGTMHCRKEEQKQHADGGAEHDRPLEHPREHTQSMIQSC